MKLIELKPQFLESSDGVKGVGVVFDCPCGNHDEEHRCFIPFVNPIGPGLRIDKNRGWQRTGETFETLTLTPSIWRNLHGGCGWHGLITNGEIITV